MIRLHFSINSYTGIALRDDPAVGTNYLPTGWEDTMYMIIE